MKRDQDISLVTAEKMLNMFAYKLISDLSLSIFEYY